jgi:PAS domain-containing protein
LPRRSDLMTAPLPRVLAGNTLRHLEQLIGGLTAGVILIDLAGAIIWANDAALAMHGAEKVDDLGGTADAYATRFSLRKRSEKRVA